MCISAYEVLLFRAAFLIAFFAFLRVGEFTVRARDHAPTLRLTDVNVRQGGGPSCLELCIRSSKTDQKGAGVAGDRVRRSSGSGRTTPAGVSSPAWRQQSERTSAAVYQRARRSGGDTGPFHENLVKRATESSVTYW